MVTRCKVFGPTTSVAGTKTQVGSDYNVPKLMNRIIGIIVTCSSAAAGEVLDGYITLEHDNVAGPFAIPVGGGVSAITSGGGPVQPIIVPLSIENVSGAILKVFITAAAAVEWTVGVLFE